MTLKEDFASSSIWAKLAFCCFLTALITGGISFTTTRWASMNIKGTKGGVYFGLWRRCEIKSDDRVQACFILDGTANEWFAVVQAMAVFGSSGILVSMFLFILYLFFEKYKKNSEIGTIAGIICIITGIMYLIGCIVFATKKNKYYEDTEWIKFPLEYGFYLAIIAILFEIAGGVFTLIEIKATNTSQHRYDSSSSRTDEQI
ncbi:peripheral myelin protein 22-like [Mytilus trossulus]|uniref:peripheral myelin protein 22-like n=1 Tax=Mytilus trossulus TaxID=6551 RepID=UPI003004265C